MSAREAILNAVRGALGHRSVDPAALRRELRPKGKASATLVLARTVDATLAIVVERSGQGVQE